MKQLSLVVVLLCAYIFKPPTQDPAVNTTDPGATLAADGSTKTDSPASAPSIPDFLVKTNPGEKPVTRKGHVAVGIRYIICASGIFPANSTAGIPGPFLGEIRMLASPQDFTIPTGWYACEGQLLVINPNQSLFSLLGTTYGGDGLTTFALPDLRGATVVGSGNGWTFGEKSK